MNKSYFVLGLPLSEPDVNKRKLYLCDRNVQAGDVLQECNKDNIARTVDHFETVLPHGIFEFTDGEFIGAHQAFKVVGELTGAGISLVYNGEDIKEERVKLKPFDYPKNHTRQWREVRSKQIGGEDLPIALISCPTCNIFH